ncbi:bifunctional diguanylate cyclase/phosphodiesterase [Virgisporangium ochraceum]
MVLAWLTVPVGQTVAAWAAWRAGSVPGLAPTGRRFWRHLAVGMLLIAFGSAGLTWAKLHPLAGYHDPLRYGTAPLLVAAVLVVSAAVLRLPVRAVSGSTLLRVGLDTACVVCTAGLFAWHFVVRQVFVADASLEVEVEVVLLCLAGLAITVAVLKVVLLGGEPIDSRAMHVLAATAVLGALASVSAPLLTHRDWHGLHPVFTLAEALLVTTAAGLQHRAGPSTVDSPGAVGTAVLLPSLLPYMSIGASAVLLTAAAYGNDEEVGIISTGTLVVIAIVVARHVLALRDNDRLVTAMRDQEEQLAREVTHDQLTGLVNRASFTRLLESAVAAGRPIAVLLIDLDDFKLINDTHGHAVGDEVLVAVAARLTDAVRGGDIVARLGGDEFAAILHLTQRAPRTDTDPTMPAVAVADRIRDLLTVPLHTAGHDLLVHASVGVAVPAPGEDPDALLRNADLAMYAAKDRGKGGHVLYTTGMTTRMIAHAELGAQLREAIATDQLFLTYQPIVDLPNGQITGTEALVRWRHPVRGTVPPGEFIPAAEQTGLIVPLGRWVLRHACAQQAAWIREHGPAAPLSIGVNVAGRQLTDPSFISDVDAALGDAGLDPTWLTIEVTETAVIDDDTAITTMHQLRDRGIRLALDDFGTAASSLGLLLTCPVTTLKLDRTFVEHITTVTRHQAVATAVVRMAEALSLDTVAEGIETAEQANLLTDLGYDRGQGYHYAPPLTADRLEPTFAAVRVP